MTTAQVIDRLRRNLVQRRGHPAVHVRGAGRPRRRTAERFRLSIHAVEHRSRSVAEMGADRRQAHGDRRGHHRRLQRPRSRRAATDAGRSTGRRRRASASGCRTSTTRSTTRSRSGRSRSSTPSATSTWWCWRSIRNSRAIRPTSNISSSPAPTARRCRCRPWCTTSAACRRWRSFIRSRFPRPRCRSICCPMCRWRSPPPISSARSRNCTCPRAFAAASTAMPAISTRPAGGSRC